MKNLYVFIFFFLISLQFFLFPQTRKANNNSGGQWDFDISFGYGANHGGLGGKATLSDIFIIGLGTFEGQTMYEVGFQYPYKLDQINEYDRMISTSYLAISFGGIGVQKETAYSSLGNYKEEKNSIDGWNLIVGYLLVFGNDGKFFIDTGIGYAFGKATFFKGTSYEQEVEMKTFTFDIGIGYRFF